MDSMDWGRLVPGSGQKVTLGDTSAATTNAFGAQTYAVRVAATGNCHVAFGKAPVAVATDALVAASQPGEVFKITPGDKMAVIKDGTATGNCNVVELSR